MKDGQKQLAGYAFTFFVIGLLLMSSTECIIQTEHIMHTILITEKHIMHYATPVGGFSMHPVLKH